MSRKFRGVVLFSFVLLIATVAWASALIHLHLYERETWLENLENRLLDLRYLVVGPRDASPDIVFVAIDDETLESAESVPDGRLLLARLIRQIADSDAKSLVLDVILANPGSETERIDLASAMGGLPTTIASAVRFDETGTASVIRPHEAFAAQADVGIVNLVNDTTGTPRFLPLYLDIDGEVLPSMPLIAATNFTGAEALIGPEVFTLGAVEIALDAGGYMPLRLLGPRGTVPTISARTLLEEPRVDELSGKLVVLGYSAAATGDLFTTPFDDDVPGAEIIATAVSQLLGGDTLRYDRTTRMWDVLLAVLLTAVILILMQRTPLLRALPLVGLVVFVFLAGVTFAFAHGVWLSAALPLAMFLPPALIAGTASLITERRQARLSEQSLTSMRRFQSPSLTRLIEQDPNFLSTPRQQALVVFFVDLTGFTSLSQKLGPEGTRELLQKFHGLTGEIVEKHNGNVINYMGDGALAIFGMEDEIAHGSAADRALQSAEALDVSVGRISLRTDGPTVSCRTGLHYGSVILSRLGAENHQQITVSGDTVNLASRLMEVAKLESAKIVATCEFTSQLSPNLLSGTTRTARVEIRGWSGLVEVVLWPRA